MASPSCVYCGSKEELTRDHVPPKGLFPKLRPVDLLSVTACSTCNSGFQKDDEYFATVVALRDDTPRSAQGARLVEKVRRSLNRPEATAFASSLRGNFLRAGDVVPDAGHHPEQRVLKADSDRLRRVAERTVRALLYHERRQTLPPEYEIKSEVFENLSASFLSVALQPLRSLQSTELAGGAFAYIWSEVADDPWTTVWLLDFHASQLFMVFSAQSDFRAPAF